MLHLDSQTLQSQIILKYVQNAYNSTNKYLAYIAKGIFNIIKHLEEKGKGTWAQEFETNLGTL